MTSIRTMVYTKAVAITDRVYFNKAPEGIAFPFVVFSFPDEGRAYHNQVEKMLQVRVYDHEKDSYNVALDRKSVV